MKKVVSLPRSKAVYIDLNNDKQDDDEIIRIFRMSPTISMKSLTDALFCGGKSFMDGMVFDGDLRDGFY